ncbi:scavenger receptor class F member 1 [Tiliqua scincoides]|uniref:scavenger receptor class F member 1 n=1 Tax=Tiliqua scincoides TaxID=71010 RepID=UPI003462B5A8
MWELLPLLLFCLQVQGPGMGSCTSELDPNGRHVCQSSSHPQVLTCCQGWKQKGRECTTALCQGADACQKDEVCVRPGVCRCKPGFFGANCNTRCPDQYWGPDCKESCRCYPHGKCDPVSGECTCHPNRWGPLCQSACQCGLRGRCDPLTGACHCEPGWWAPDCKKQCQCNLSGSRCDPATGRCFCHGGWWGKRCTFHCTCSGSPCAQETGRCECKAGMWGAFCQNPCHCLYGTCSPQDGQCTCEAGYRGQSCTDTCPAGTYGLQCRYRCGHCKHQQACFPVDGSCLACEPGWNGTHCNQSCPLGLHGENCTQPCPRCLQGETCHPETGKCRNCEPGLTGDRCEMPCPPGLFGNGCRFSCPDCINGSCDPVSGECVCQAGYWGISCNKTCPEGFHGPNCSEPCQCQGDLCHPLTGDCQLRGKNQEALIAGILTPLLFLLLCVCCCCFCCCGSAPMDPGDRAAVADGNPVSRMKHHVLGALANLSSTLPCFSLGGYKLPRVTVSHHDAEIPFNPSFIEPPSAAWPLDSSFSSSFDTDNEDDQPEGPVYQLPAGEAPDADLQPGFLPEASALNLEPFAIPRTSSIAKAKRPSVSFAEGTRFEGQTQGSTETLNPLRKSKTSWGLARVASPPQPTTSPEQETPQDNSPGNIYENVEAGPREEETHRSFLRSTPGGRRKRLSSSRNVAQRVEALEAASKAQDKEPAVTTIYMMVGKAAGRSEGPVQAILQQLGSLQRVKQPPRKEPRLRRSLEGLQKPLWRTQDLEKNTRTLLTQDKTDLESTVHDPELSTTKAEAQGLLGGLPAPSLEEAGECKSLELTQSHNQPERAVGEGALEEKTQEGEPKYENVSGLVQYPLATT